MSIVGLKFLFHSDIVGNYWADSPLSMLPIYSELIAAGLRIWAFRSPLSLSVSLYCVYV